MASQKNFDFKKDNRIFDVKKQTREELLRSMNLTEEQIQQLLSKK